jgi:hypothetical protein
MAPVVVISFLFYNSAYHWRHLVIARYACGPYAIFPATSMWAERYLMAQPYYSRGPVVRTCGSPLLDIANLLPDLAHLLRDLAHILPDLTHLLRDLAHLLWDLRRLWAEVSGLPPDERRNFQKSGMLGA